MMDWRFFDALLDVWLKKLDGRFRKARHALVFLHLLSGSEVIAYR
jgi:hypothetical protein